LSDGIKVTVKLNLGGVNQKLLRLEPKIAQNVLGVALEAVGKMWIEAVKEKVPVLCGDLKNSIISNVWTRSRGAGKKRRISGEVEVGPAFFERTDEAHDAENSQGPGIYGMFVEFGLQTKNYPKEPFMRPAFDATTDKAINLFANTLRDSLAEVVNED
jgi:HK97 gp10 family phage protein